MSNDKIDEDYTDRSAHEGEQLKMLIYNVLESAAPDTTVGAIVNALGGLLADTIMSIDATPEAQLAEFDRWAAYTRQHLIACQKIVDTGGCSVCAPDPEKPDNRIVKPYDGAQPKHADIHETVITMMGGEDGPRTRAEIDGQLCELLLVLVDINADPDYIRELHWFPVPREQLQ